MSIHTDHIPTPRHRRQPPVPDTPEALAHAEETEALRLELMELAEDINEGVPLIEQIRPSTDGRGHLRMNFPQMRALLRHIADLEAEIEALDSSV